MKNFKTFFSVGSTLPKLGFCNSRLRSAMAAPLLALGIAMAPSSAMAQDTEDDGLDYKPFPHMFVSIQGGGQSTICDYKMFKLVTPTASVGFGAWFTPVVGARLHVNGIWNKGGLTDVNGVNQTYDYRYVTTDLDLMLNLVTLFGRKNYYPVNLYLIGGIGLNTAWGNDDACALNNELPLAWSGTRFSHNARVGAQLDINVHKNVSVNLELAANSLADRYNSQHTAADDWQITAQVGLAFKFGYKAKPKQVPVVEPVEEVWETRIDTTWYDDVTYKDVYEDDTIDKRIFYTVREDVSDDVDKQTAAVAEFLKELKDAKVYITAYADKGTGNPKLNMGYSKKRAEKTRDALIAKGVDPNIIKGVSWKGDTVQPYSDNDKNRVSIITVHGLIKKQEKVVTKKFKTEEVRYRVK